MNPEAQIKILAPLSLVLTATAIPAGMLAGIIGTGEEPEDSIVLALAGFLMLAGLTAFYTCIVAFSKRQFLSPRIRRLGMTPLPLLIVFIGLFLAFTRYSEMTKQQKVEAIMRDRLQEG